MVSNSGGDFVFIVKYQSIIDDLESEDICQFDFWLANITQISQQKKLHNQTVVGMGHHCCISALQDLIMEGEQHAPDQFNHTNRHYERHLDDLGAPREIWMRLSEHHKKGSKWTDEQKLRAAREYRKDLVNKAAHHWYCRSSGDFHERLKKLHMHCGYNLPTRTMPVTSTMQMSPPLTLLLPSCFPCLTLAFPRR
jgi:hypothetical protein